MLLKGKKNELILHVDSQPGLVSIKIFINVPLTETCVLHH